MPFELFDRKKLILKPLSERVSDLDLSSMLEIGDKIPDFNHRSLPILADKISAALKSGASVMMMMGGHVIRSGVSRFLIELMKKKIITHFALNGSCIIHDFELALAGETTESVERYISEVHNKRNFEKTIIIPFGVNGNISRYLEFNNSFEHKNQILGVGAIIGHRDYVYQLKVFAELLKTYPSLQFKIIGNQYIDKPVKIAEELGIDDRIIFTGELKCL